jgi:hypothetical protein
MISLYDAMGTHTATREASTALVYATAVFKSSPFSQITQHYFNYLSDIIDSKEHLQKNIEDFKFGNISSWEAGNQKYDHQIQVIF